MIAFDGAEHLLNDTSFDDILLYDKSRNLFDFLLLSISGCTNLLQIFIIWLILFRTPGNMRVYRLYLCGMAFSDLLFNFTIGFLIEPKLWAPDSLGSHVMGLAQFIGHNGGRIAVSYSVAAFALTCQVQFLMFSTIFRFASVKHMDHTALHLYLQKLGFRVKMVVGVMAVALLVASVSYLTIIDQQSLIGWHFSLWPLPSNWSTEYMNELATPLDYTGNSGQPAFNQPALLDAISDISSIEAIKKSWGKNLLKASESWGKELVMASVRYAIRTEVYSNEMKHIVNAIQLGYPILYLDYLNAWLFGMCFTYFGCILFVETTCLCLGTSISVIRYLRRHRHCFNAQTYRMQMQLIILLIIQIVEPMLLVFMPIMYILFSLLTMNAESQASFPMFNIQSREFAQSIVIALVIYSAVNTLLILCFVGPYRREFCALVNRPFLPILKQFRHQHAAVQPIVHHHNAFISTNRYPSISI